LVCGDKLPKGCTGSLASDCSPPDGNTETLSVDDSGEIVSNSNIGGIEDNSNADDDSSTTIGVGPETSMVSENTPISDRNINDSSSSGTGLSFIDTSLIIAGVFALIAIILFWFFCVRVRRKKVLFY
jgi:hypothetical protein